MSMTFIHRSMPVAAAAAMLALSMAGCGGGGGDAGGSAITVPTTPVAITAANQDSVSRTAAAATQGGFASGTVPLAADGRAHALASARTGASSRSLASVFAPLALHALRSPAATGRATPSAAIDLGSGACTLSGSASATLDDRDNSNTATVGDTISVTFSNCEDFAGEKVNGTLSLSLSQLTPGALLSFTASAAMSGLSLSAAGHSVAYDGDMTMTYTETSATVSTVQVTVGSQLAVRIATPSFSDTIAMLGGYRITTITDSAALPPGGTLPGKSTSTASGEVASTAAGGKVTVNTIAPVVEYDADDFPASGQLHVVGAAGSLTLTALTGGQVRVDLDTNSDGTVDSTKTVDWAFLF